MTRMSATLRADLSFAAVVVAIMIIIGLVNPHFWQPENLFSLLRGNIVVGILALGFLTVLISGGIDVSFAAVGGFAMWISISFAFSAAPNSIVLPFALAVVIGVVLGCVNALVVDKIKVIPLIATLATASVIHGILLGALGAKVINLNKMPPNLIDAARINLFTIHINGGGHAGLPAVFLLYVTIALFMQYFLSTTLVGRSIYAVGGDVDAARRIGFSVLGARIAAYGLAGALAGFAAVLDSALNWNAEPRALDNQTLDVIAAVVLGGASIFGGRGSVLGTVLGVFMLVLVKNSLIILGVPTTWQRVCIGVIIIGATASSFARRPSAST